MVALTLMIGLLLAAVIVVGKILEPSSALPGYTSLMAVVLIFGGVQLLSIGLMGEYVGRIYRESKRRPLYFVAERLNFDDFDDDRGEA